MGAVQHAKKEAASAANAASSSTDGERPRDGDDGPPAPAPAPAQGKARLLEEIRRATKKLEGIEREQARLTDALRAIAMAAAANAMAHEQRRAERRAGRATHERRERAQTRYSARATRLLQQAARAFAAAAAAATASGGEAKAARLLQQEQEAVLQQGGGESASTSALSSPTRSGRHPSLSSAAAPPQPQHCFRAGGAHGYCYAPDPWQFDPFLCPLPPAVPLPRAVLAAQLESGRVVDPLLAANGPGGADKAAQGSLPLPEEYQAGPPPPPAMLPRRGDAIRGVALDVPNPFDAASRAVAAAGEEGLGRWLPRQESQMRDAVLPAGLLAEAGVGSDGGGRGCGGGMLGGGEEGAVVERLEGLMGMGAQLVLDPALLAEARVRVGVGPWDGVLGVAIVG